MITEGTLLLIEDEPADIILFLKAAEELGFNNKVTVVKNGEEALGFLNDNADILFMILCDMNMPKMTGMELKKELEKTAQRLNKTIPFIFFSTAKTELDLEDAYELRVQGYFLKGENYQQYLLTLQIIIKYWDLCEHPGSIKNYSKQGIA